MILKIEVQKGEHVGPSLFELNFGGFQMVEVCNDCNTHIASSSVNNHNPCKNCGGNYSTHKRFAGIYKSGKWCKRIS